MLRTTTGSINNTSASDTAKALCGNPNVAIHRAKTNSAATIEGTPARMSTMKVVTFAKVPRPYSTRYIAAMTPSGIDSSAAIPAWITVP